MRMDRRAFVGSMISVGVATMVRAQGTAANEWGSPVIDCHFHPRPTLAANLAHLNGSGCQAAYCLTSVRMADDVKRFMQEEPTRIAGYSASTDMRAADAVAVLTAAVKAGAHGFGEVKSHVDCDGPEMKRLYAAAAELNVPITMHFQEFPHFANEGTWNSGFKRFDKMLQQFPKTTFVGHCDAFWANLSTDYDDKEAYPRTPIKPGGITDKWLSDYPNLHADLSANSGNNALTRSPDFTSAFLKRHSEKLFFGSDCTCTDGHGGGNSANGNPAGFIVGKCVARETLTAIKAHTDAALFRKLVWENGHRMYKLS